MSISRKTLMLFNNGSLLARSCSHLWSQRSGSLSKGLLVRGFVASCFQPCAPPVLPLLPHPLCALTQSKVSFLVKTGWCAPGRLCRGGCSGLTVGSWPVPASRSPPAPTVALLSSPFRSGPLPPRLAEGHSSTFWLSFFASENTE